MSTPLEDATLDMESLESDAILEDVTAPDPKTDWLGSMIYFARRLLLTLLTLGAAWLLLLLLRDMLPTEDLRGLGDSPNWSRSWTIAKGLPVADLLESRRGPTLVLVGAAMGVSLISATLYALIALLIHRLGEAVPPLGSVLRGLGRLWVFRNAAVPVFVIALLGILLFGIKFRNYGWPYLPTGGLYSQRVPPDGSLLDKLNAGPGSNLDRFIHLLQPMMVLSLLTSVLTAQVVARELARQRQRGGCMSGSLRLILLTLGALLSQVGGILSASIVVELLLARPGLGRMVYSAARQLDYPVLIGVAQIFLLIVIGGRLLAYLLLALERLLASRQGPEQETEPTGWQRGARWAWLAVGLLALLLPLALGVWGLTGDREAAINQMNIGDTNADRSSEHPLGTDKIGRDIYERLRVGTWQSLRLAGLVAGAALALGGLGGLLAGLLTRMRGWVGETLADLVLWPADVLMAVPPLMLLLILILVWQPAQRQVGVHISLVAALVVVVAPRVAWALRNLLAARSPRRHVVLSVLGGGLAVGLGAVYAALLFGTMLSFLGFGVLPPEPSIGNILNEAQSELWVYTFKVTAPGLVLLALMYGFYLAANVLIDVLDFRSKDVLAEFNK